MYHICQYPVALQEGMGWNSFSRAPRQWKSRCDMLIYHTGHRHGFSFIDSPTTLCESWLPQQSFSILHYLQQLISNLSSSIFKSPLSHCQTIPLLVCSLAYWQSVSNWILVHFLHNWIIFPIWDNACFNMHWTASPVKKCRFDNVFTNMCTKSVLTVDIFW